MKEDLYYVYRIQYENLLNDMDDLSCKMSKTKVSKEKIISELNNIIRVNYKKTCSLIEHMKEEVK